MPRIPIPAGVPRGSFAGLLQPSEVTRISEAGARLGRQVAELGATLDRQRERDETNRGTLAGLEALGLLEDELRRDPGIAPAERIRRYKERAQEAIEDAAGNTTHPRAGEGVRINLGLASERQLVRMRREAFEDEKAASITTLAQMKTEYINRAATAETPEDRDLVIGMYASAIKGNEFLEPHEKQAELAAIPRAVEETQARRLMKEDPAQLIARMDAGEFLEIPGPLREQLRNAAIDESERQTNLSLQIARQAKKDQEEQASIEIVKRFFDPEHPEGTPSIPEILEAPLPRTVIEHFIDLAQRQAEGGDIDYLDDALVNDLFRRVHDPVHPRPITHASQLIGYIGNGLPRAEYEKFRVDIEDLKAPEARARDTLWTEFFERADSSITRTSLFGKDAKGDQNFYAFRVRVELIREKWKAEGRDEMELLDPSNPNHVGKIIQQYRRTPQQQAMDQVEEIRGVEVEKVSVPTREKGESTDAYLERISPILQALIESVNP